MSASLQLQHVALNVADLGRQVAFYTDQLGFTVASRSGQHADLAVEPGSQPILELRHAPDAVAASPRSPGLFHAALLFPTRAALGRWLIGAAERQVEFDGFSDHGVSEALYFSDPEGNGLEFYADRSPDVWPRIGDQIDMVTKPLDVRGLLADAAPESASPLAGARWGHLHLRVTNLEQSEAFYGATLGMTVTQRTYPGARFMAADGYHHHLGLNTWGHPSGRQPANALGLASATFGRRGIASTNATVDPDGITIRTAPL